MAFSDCVFMITSLCDHIGVMWRLLHNKTAEMEISQSLKLSHGLTSQIHVLGSHYLNFLKSFKFSCLKFFH